MAIELTKETKQEMISSIRKYFREELDEEIGNLRADQLLDFCLREICPTVYNQAIRDAQAYFQERVSDLEGSCYELEMTFWKKEPRRGRR